MAKEEDQATDDHLSALGPLLDDRPVEEEAELRRRLQDLAVKLAALLPHLAPSSPAGLDPTRLGGGAAQAARGQRKRKGLPIAFEGLQKFLEPIASQQEETP